MWNVFEQPWTLLGAAVIVLFAVLTYRSVVPEKQRRWHWLLPLAVAAIGFGLDHFVATDPEKIETLLKQCFEAVETENCRALARLIAADYRDSHHNSKEALMARCRDKLKPSTVESLKKVSTAPEISPPKATVTFTLLVKLDKNSPWAQSYKPTALVKVRIDLRKQPDKTWLIGRTEILEVDKMPVSWGVT